MSEQKGPRGVDPKLLFMFKKEKVNTSSSLAGDNRIFSSFKRRKIKTSKQNLHATLDKSTMEKKRNTKTRHLT